MLAISYRHSAFFDMPVLTTTKNNTDTHYDHNTQQPFYYHIVLCTELTLQLCVIEGILVITCVRVGTQFEKFLLPEKFLWISEFEIQDSLCFNQISLDSPPSLSSTPFCWTL